MTLLVILSSFVSLFSDLGRVYLAEDKTQDKHKYKQIFIFFKVTLSALQMQLLSTEPLLKIMTNNKKNYTTGFSSSSRRNWYLSAHCSKKFWKMNELLFNKITDFLIYYTLNSLSFFWLGKRVQRIFEISACDVMWLQIIQQSCQGHSRSHSIMSCMTAAHISNINAGLGFWKEYKFVYRLKFVNTVQSYVFNWTI